MAQLIGTNSNNYLTQIPSLSENADIQTALRLYHFGQTSEPATLVSNSIAGHLKNLEDTKVDIVPIQITTGSGNDLDQKIITGYYSAATNSVASAGSNYPTGATAGMLHVINDGSGIIYQTYQTNSSKFYWRGFFAGGWSDWLQAADTGFVSVDVSSRLTSLENNKQNNIPSNSAITSVLDTNLDTNKVVVSDGTGKIRASADITVTELGYLNGATSQVQTTILGNKAPLTPLASGIKRMIIARPNNAGLPDATVTPVEGDLWFW
jgi:hypothetical protein